MKGLVLRQRRWTVIASGLLCGILALVVLFTNRRAFSSPLAVVVVAAIGFAALLLQLRLRTDATAIHLPTWLSVVGAAFAVAALLADLLRLNGPIPQVMTLCAVCAFGMAGAFLLRSFRRGGTSK